METVGDLLSRDPHDGVALRTPSKEYTEETFYTTCHKTANLLNHLGLREGGSLTVTSRPDPETVFAVLGGALVGARLGFTEDGGADEDTDVLFLGVDEHAAGEAPPGCRTVVYGTDGDSPTGATSFEREIWGENPVFPHGLRTDGDAEVLPDATAADLVERARREIEDRDLWNGDEVRVDTLDEEGVVDVVAALAARATVVVEG